MPKVKFNFNIDMELDETGWWCGAAKIKLVGTKGSGVAGFQGRTQASALKDMALSIRALLDFWEEKGVYKVLSKSVMKRLKVQKGLKNKGEKNVKDF